MWRLFFSSTVLAAPGSSWSPCLYWVRQKKTKKNIVCTGSTETLPKNAKKKHQKITATPDFFFFETAPNTLWRAQAWILCTGMRGGRTETHREGTGSKKPAKESKKQAKPQASTHPSNHPFFFCRRNQSNSKTTVCACVSTNRRTQEMHSKRPKQRFNSAFCGNFAIFLLTNHTCDKHETICKWEPCMRRCVLHQPGVCGCTGESYTMR